MDIFEVLSIKQTDSDGVDLSSKFDLDNGQRPNFYQHGRLVVKRDTTPPSGTIFSRLKYFAHGDKWRLLFCKLIHWFKL